MPAKVVITGLGAVSPIGSTLEMYWTTLLYGESLPSPHPYRRPEYMNNRLTYRVQDEIPVLVHAGEQTGRASTFAIRASEMALRDAGFACPPTGEVFGMCLGTGTGDHDLIETEREGGELASPLGTFAFGVAGVVADRLHITGPNLTVSNACAAGCYSLSIARDAITAGWADVMVVGGVDSISRVVHGAFNRLGAADPQVCRPFDAHRAGTLYGEGAAILILESEAHARRRGQLHWYAEVKGYGWSCDGHHPTAPDPSGRQSEQALRRALEDADTPSDAIDCIVCHGTGTELNDLAESNALERVFGDDISRLLACAIKSKLGHSAGAAGAFSCLTGALILDRELVPPTANLTTVDPRCRLNLHVDWPVPASSVRNVLVNALAFGGTNIAIVLGKAAT